MESVVLDRLVDGEDLAVYVSRGRFEDVDSGLFFKVVDLVKNCLRDSCTEAKKVGAHVWSGVLFNGPIIPFLNTALQHIRGNDHIWLYGS